MLWMFVDFWFVSGCICRWIVCFKFFVCFNVGLFWILLLCGIVGVESLICSWFCCFLYLIVLYLLFLFGYCIVLLQFCLQLFGNIVYGIVGFWYLFWQLYFFFICVCMCVCFLKGVGFEQFQFLFGQVLWRYIRFYQYKNIMGFYIFFL